MTSLNQLLECVVAAADGKQIDRERAADASTETVCAPGPASGIQQRVGKVQIVSWGGA